MQSSSKPGFPVREVGNAVDRYAVAVYSDDNLVGHLPKKISIACSLFLRHGGQISCWVTGRRRHSTDLPQGGLEIPCIIKFKATKKRLRINFLY